MASRVDLRDAKDTGRSALHLAAANGHLDVCRFLVEELGFGVNSTCDNTGGSPVLYAAANGRESVLRYLIDRGARWSINISICWDSTRRPFWPSVGGLPVLYPAANGRESVLRYLIDRGADPGMPDSKGATPLHLVAKQGHCEAVRLLLSKGVDVDPLFGHGTPLQLAIPNDRDQVVKILLEHGADPNKFSNASSPLALVCCGYSLKCMKLLVE